MYFMVHWSGNHVTFWYDPWVCEFNLPIQFVIVKLSGIDNRMKVKIMLDLMVIGTGIQLVIAFLLKSTSKLR